MWDILVGLVVGLVACIGAFAAGYVMGKAAGEVDSAIGGRPFEGRVFGSDMDRATWDRMVGQHVANARAWHRRTHRRHRPFDELAAVAEFVEMYGQRPEA